MQKKTRILGSKIAREMSKAELDRVAGGHGCPTNPSDLTRDHHEV